MQKYFNMPPVYWCISLLVSEAHAESAQYLHLFQEWPLFLLDSHFQNRPSSDQDVDITLLAQPEREV